MKIKNKVKRNKFIAYTLLDFWIASCSSVLLDLDHLWKYSGNKEPINFTGWIGRPFHHPMVILLYSFVLGWFAIAFIFRWNVSIRNNNENLKN